MGVTAPTRDEALKRYKRFMADADPEHRRVLKEMAEYSQGYGLNSIQGEDLVGLGRVWGDHPPEIGVILANVDVLFGSFYGSRREPTFPGFDQGLKDDVLGEYLTMLVKQGRRWAGSDACEGAALMDLIQGGYAFATLALDTDRRPPFRPEEEPAGVDTVWWDKGARKENMEDGQEWAVRSFFSVREAAAKYPDDAAAIRALDPDDKSGGASSGKKGAPAAGAKALGGPSIAVSVSATGAQDSGGEAGKKRLREAAIDDFQFLHFEELVSWEMPDPETGQPVRQETSAEDFQAAMAKIGKIAQKAGAPFKPPATLPYAASTWYRCKVLARSIAGEPKVLTDPEPIPGGKPLVRAMTGKPEWIQEGETLKRRWFGVGRVLLGLQRLVSVAIRIELEQEARRNRASGAIEQDAFPDGQAALQRFVDARAVPGSWPVVPPGAMAKIHEFDNTVGSRVSSMRELFNFLAIELPKHVLGLSEMSRGTFEGDRSAKFLDTMLQASSQMQTQFSSAFTRFLDQGAITMARLMLELLDAADIDRILGATGAKLREGITGQKNPETGEMEPLMVPDPAAPPQPNPETGEMEPAMVAMTAGRYLKENAGEIFDHDVAFALRPTAASERAANAQLMLQHGVLKEMLAAGAPPEIIIPKILQASFAQGTLFAEMADELETYYANLKEQQEEQAAAATDEGWIAHIQEVAATDFEKASQLMQQASEAVLGPQSEQPAPEGA